MVKTRTGHKKPGGWGIVILVLVLAVTVVVVLLGGVVCEVKRTEQAVNDLYGDAPSFVPAADGAIPPERVEAFLRVRERVFEHCTEFQDRLTELAGLDAEDKADSLSTPRIARESVGGIKMMFRFGRTFLRFMETRNRALLQEEMGLGEYMYIYVLTYREQLLAADTSRFAGVEEVQVGIRARKELAQILQNQLDLLESGVPGVGRAGEVGLAEVLREQVAALRAGQQTLPWEAGLPPAVASSLSPFSNQLASLYCDGIAKIELSQKNKGLNIRN
jgi:hypothetical protein